MTTNPYSLQFGKIPKTYVKRISAIDTVGLSSTDISICMSLLRKELGTDKVKVGNLAEEMNITSGFLNVYKNRLMRSEVIKSAGYGYISFTLPRFDVFCRNKRDEMY